MGGDERKAPDASGAFPAAEAPTLPGAPSPLRRDATELRSGWGFERDGGPSGPIARVLVMCRACLRTMRMGPPRFYVTDDGEVIARDEGASFTCAHCSATMGPLRLADWRFGRLA